MTFASPQSKNGQFTFLIDTGAATSIIKFENLNFNSNRINKNKSITLSGIKSEINTMGTSPINLTKNHDKFNFEFNVIDQEFNIPYDGIIGHDFLSQFQADISYKNNTIAFHKSFKLQPSTITQVPIHFITNNTDNVTINGMNDRNIIVPGNILITNETKYYPVINKSNEPFNLPPLKIIGEKAVEVYFIQNSDSKHRSYQLKSNLRTEHLNKEEKEELENICESFSDIFFLPGDHLSSTDTIEHEIKTTEPSPVVTKNYRYPKVHEQEVQDQIRKMIDQNIIRPSNSPWSAPLWVVPKKKDASGKQKWRIVTDYRKLNDITITDKFPLPNIEEILDQLGEASYFTTLDLANGFHQIKMKEEDKPKTAFSTPRGHYEFNRMTFGLKNAPATFQRLMNTVLMQNLGTDCFVYLDDIVIFGKSLKDHNDKLCRIFKALRQHNLKLQPDKCEFLRKEVAYLGHIISDKGVEPNPEKIQAVVDRKEPRNPKDIKSFLGLTGYYRRFIPNYAQLAKPLTSLLKKDTIFKFDEKCKESFLKLKQFLISKPILQYPDFSKPFVLTTDASNEAIGSILSQGEHDLPIAYYSATLNNAERNYSTTEKELLAIVKSCKHFRPYLYGTEFKIVTDHKPLQWLMNCKDPASRLVRWRLKLGDYQYKIVYKSGKTNINADALSRPVLTIQDKSFEDFKVYHQSNLNVNQYPKINKPLEQFKNIVFPYSCDLSLNNAYSTFVTSNCILKNLKLNKISEIAKLKSETPNQHIYLLFTKDKAKDEMTYPNIYHGIRNLFLMLKHNQETEVNIINIPQISRNINQQTFESLIQYLNIDNIKVNLIIGDLIHPTKDQRKTILTEYHTDALSGHPGVNRTFQEVKKTYFWKGMKQEIENFIKTCDVCQRNKKINIKTPMVITSTANDFAEAIACDIMGPYPITKNNNRYILTVQDELTKFVQAYPISEISAETCAIHLIKYFSIFGFPNTILTDQGTNFMSNLLKEINKILQIKHKITSPYHPQTNGSLERTHASIKSFIKSYVGNNPETWDEYVYLASHSYNTHENRSTKERPYTLVFGREPKIPRSLEKPKELPTYQNLTKDILNKAKIIRDTAKENLFQSKIVNKKYYDKNSKENKLAPGDQVLLFDSLNISRFDRKFNSTYKGPYEVIQVHSNNTASIQISKNKIRTYHLNKLKRYLVSDDENGRDDCNFTNIPMSNSCDELSDFCNK